MRETDLYLPVKAYLEKLGYTVKSEIKDCDIVAISNDLEHVAQPLIVELKLAFSLELIHQGINRQKLSDRVYLAVPEPDTAIKKRNWRTKLKANIKLCRMLGLGVMTVEIKSALYQGEKVLLDPAPYAPRKNTQRQSGLKTEFIQRVGDPNTGGINKQKIMTAYRQRVLLCAFYLSIEHKMSLKVLRLSTDINDCAQILQKNYYGWFERVARGEYCLTQNGLLAVNENKQVIAQIINEKDKEEKKEGDIK